MVGQKKSGESERLVGGPLWAMPPRSGQQSACKFCCAALSRGRRGAIVRMSEVIPKCERGSEEQRGGFQARRRGACGLQRVSE